MNKQSILLVEDEDILATILSDTLEDEGYLIYRACDGVEGLKQYSDKKPDLIIADVMMPNIDGFKMVRFIRETDKITPVLFLTAKAGIDDLVSGFEIGGNDYLRKPFKMKELIVRTKALLNRINEKLVFQVGGYTFNPTTQELTINSCVRALSHFENEVLNYLVINKNETVLINNMLTNIWTGDPYYDRNSLHGYIHKLRKYLSNDKSISIINERGIGYKLIEK